MEGLYLFIDNHTPVYYPVNYVEIKGSRDVFWGSRDDDLKGGSATEMSHEWVPYVGSR